MKRKADRSPTSSHHEKVNTKFHEDVVARANAQTIAIFAERHVPKDRLLYSPRARARTGSNAVGDGTHTRSYVIDLRAWSNSDFAPGSLSSFTLSSNDLAQCLDLIAETSQAAYASSSMGWNPKQKRKEMCQSEMRYLIARREEAEHVHRDSEDLGAKVKNDASSKSDTVKSLAGFISFMVTHEDGIPVIYVYEVHLDVESRGCGLGAHLLSLVEQIGSRIGLEKCMLTVFRSNETAMTWYFHRGYGIDEYSPPDKKLRGGKVKQADYLILSKALN